MAYDAALVAWVAEAMAPAGMVTMRRMMGVATLYCDNTVFAIADADTLWFKADATSDAAWDAAGCARFTFTDKEGRVMSMNYRRAPDDVYDDADTLLEWGRLALEAGRRAPVKKRKKQPPAIT